MALLAAQVDFGGQAAPGPAQGVIGGLTVGRLDLQILWGSEMSSGWLTSPFTRGCVRVRETMFVRQVCGMLRPCRPVAVSRVRASRELAGAACAQRLAEGVAGIGQLHGLIGAHLSEGGGDAEVVIGIETDRGPWVTALIAAGYTVFPVNPLQWRFTSRFHGA